MKIRHTSTLFVAALVASSGAMSLSGTRSVPATVTAVARLPDEPVEIGTGPQFLLDDYIVDNYWALKYKREAVRRVLHPPHKYEGNPVIAGDAGNLSVARDHQTGRWQMWYQTSIAGDDEDRTQYAIAYAESRDGIDWTRPNLGMFNWRGSRDNNIVWTGFRGRRASSPFLLDVPEQDRRGYRHVMLYRETDGMRLIGSHDGIRWDKSSDTRISPIHSDTQNAIVYDATRRQYVMYCRAKHVYRTFRGDVRDTGESRRIARMVSDELWTDWKSEPQNILVPDELDADAGFDCFYGMPTARYGGVYWGLLWLFKTNTDIHTELAFSRDGVRFERLAGRPKLIERGLDGAWDDGMVFGGYQWIEVGDEWWMYYSGWDGPHETRDRTAGIGLVKLRKEGFVSFNGPPGGGVIVTRAIRWPGGELRVNADCARGELRVRVSDGRRKVVDGFDYDDCEPFHGDSVSAAIRWNGRSLESLAGQVIRLEFLLKSGDIYTFRATGGS